MNKKAINDQQTRTLKEFYALIDETRNLRVRIVKNIFNNKQIEQYWIESLKNVLASLVNIPMERGKRVLFLDDSKKMPVDLVYEITELEKDVFYLENGEEKFIEYLGDLHPGFREQVNRSVKLLEGLNFNCFITDRDGTINNYCGRFRSSVQSVYNSLFLVRFAIKRTVSPVIVTSAPLKNFGIMDVSINPEKSVIYAASKGREFVDLHGVRQTYPIDKQRQGQLDNLNKRLLSLVKAPVFEKFSLIGSGFQHKFGQTTIARQDISGSIPEDESDNFLKKIISIVSDLDPQNKDFRIEDTGLDIEIILTVGDSRSGFKDFDKGDAVKFLDEELRLGMTDGPNLICGDTYSDIPMLEAAKEKTDNTWAMFVTKDRTLAGKVRDVCPNSIILAEPDMLITILNFLSKVPRQKNDFEKV
ncbi:MAG: trehalose 6-phosphate synthase [Deltaproteobacteria bacterium]|nr:trehalose 6-phosphate synthase [Deltaproteobacteria bacterium]